MRIHAVVGLIAFSVGTALAQSSASFKISDAVLNAGGHPVQGQKPASASYQISLDAIGDPVTRGDATSTTYATSAGLIGRYRPPDELKNLRFNVKVNLLWDHDAAPGKSNLYRGASASGAAACYQPDLPENSFIESSSPATGSGWYYLVGAENLLGEEGLLGTGAGGAPRTPVVSCP